MITKNQLKAKSINNMSSYDEDDYLISYAADNNIKLYKEHGEDLKIELHDNRTMWKIEKDINDDYCVYTDILQDYINKFEQKTKQKVYFEGRSGRHCNVELTKHNLLHYQELKNLAEHLEKDFIKEINGLKQAMK